jgi:regulator of sirC expression with transglutaminase-like and TPR domain
MFWDQLTHNEGSVLAYFDQTMAHISEIATTMQVEEPAKCSALLALVATCRQAFSDLQAFIDCIDDEHRVERLEAQIAKVKSRLKTPIGSVSMKA